MALTLRIVEPGSKAKYLVMVTVRCSVLCINCKWKGLRTVHFLEGLDEKHTAKEMQNSLLKFEESHLHWCPKCNKKFVKFVRVPNANA